MPKIINSYSAVTTVLHARNQQYTRFGRTIPYASHAVTTLNSHYNVATGVSLANAGYPYIKCFGIGIGGFAVTNSNSVNVYRPASTDMDLYTPIPFRIIKLNDLASNDLTAAEKAGYRMREIYTDAAGDVYARYWLKVLTFPSDTVSASKTDFATGATTDLAIGSYTVPTPTLPTVDNVVQGARIYTTYPYTCKLTGAEFNEVAAYYPALTSVTNGTSLINEIGLYSGIDVVYDDTNGNDTSDAYTEFMHTQLAAHMCFGGIDLSNQNTQVEISNLFEDGMSVILP